jgi:phage terminase large subunit GpA-like protein
MDACCDPRVKRVVVMAASQVVGKSQMMNNVIGRFIDVDPSNMPVMHPTIASAEKWSIGRLDPLIQETPRLHGKIQPRKSRSIGDRILHRQFRGGQMFIVGSNAPADLAAQSVRIVLADEVDRYEASAGEEGDPLELAEQRTETYGSEALVLHISTPLIDGQSRIQKSYQESDQRIWQIWCRHCDGHFAPEDHHLVVPERADGSKSFSDAHMVCGLCGTAWTESDRVRAIDAGRFLPRKPFDGIVGFHINALGCKRTDLVKIARRRERVKGLMEAEKTYTNLVLGLPYQVAAEAPDWQRLHDRREPYRMGSVPDGVVLLTAGADVQRDRIEVDVWGWGLNHERWLIDHFVVEGRPEREETWRRLDELLEERFEQKSSGAELKITRLAIDTGDGAYVQDVYRWAWRHRGDAVVMPVKGVAGFNRAAPVGGPTYVEVAVGGGRKLKRGARLFTVSVDVFKSSLHKSLLLDRPTEEQMKGGATYPAGYVHLPVGTTDEWLKQLTAERRMTVTNRRTGQSRQEWVKGRERNEALDCAVYAASAAWVLGLDRWSEKKWQAEIEKRGVSAFAGASEPPSIDPLPPARVSAAQREAEETERRRVAARPADNPFTANLRPGVWR